jgi:hypothetical protein
VAADRRSDVLLVGIGLTALLVGIGAIRPLDGEQTVRLVASEAARV